MATLPQPCSLDRQNQQHNTLPSNIHEDQTPGAAEYYQHLSQRSELLALTIQNYVTHDKQLYESSIQPRPERQIRVAGISQHANEDLLVQYFSQAGKVLSITLQAPDLRHIEYTCVDDTFRAVMLFHGKTASCFHMNGPISVQRSSTPASRIQMVERAAHRLHAEYKTATFVNLPFTTRPSEALSHFFGTFGTVESYTIVPYNLEHSLAHVRYASHQDVTTAVDTCREKNLSICLQQKFTAPPDHQASQQYKEHTSKVVCYPGVYKPLLLMHKYDLYPTVSITPQSPTSVFLQVYGNAEENNNLSNVNNGNQHRQITNNHPLSTDLSFDLQGLRISGCYTPYSLANPLVPTRPSLSKSLIIANTPDPANPGNHSSPLAKKPGFYALMLSNLYDIKVAPTMEEAKELLQDVLYEISKYGKIHHHVLNPNGTLVVVFNPVACGDMNPDLFKAIQHLFHCSYFNGRKLGCVSLQESVVKKMIPGLSL